MPGFAADVAVFSRDLLAASPEEVLEDTVCDLTLLGGEIVHNRLGEAGARAAPHQLRSVPSSRLAIAK